MTDASLTASDLPLFVALLWLNLALMVGFALWLIWYCWKHCRPTEPEAENGDDADARQLLNPL